jgi:hypothetical protein
MVAHLGLVGRFNNSTRQPWTVLHHTLLVSLIWLKHYGTADGLEHVMLHDAHEYVTGDIPSPVKNAIGREHVERVEHVVDERIRAELKVSKPDDIDRKCVKVVDWAALFIEAFYVGQPHHVEHIVESSLMGLSSEMRDLIGDAIDGAGFPQVLKAMRDAGFYWVDLPEEPKK